MGETRDSGENFRKEDASKKRLNGNAMDDSARTLSFQQGKKSIE
jgi:hypothetical protein